MQYFHLLSVVFNLLTLFWFSIENAEGIVGGNSVIDEHYKYVVSVQANNKHVCGGAIIDKGFILTAAHCVIDTNNKFIKKKITIIARITSFKFNIPPGITVDVEKIYVSSMFKPFQPVSSSRNNNYPKETIAVLKLKHNLPQDSNLMELKLPKKHIGQYSTYYNEELTISGFGIDTVDTPTKGGSSSSGSSRKIKYNNISWHMKYINATVLHQNQCRGFYGRTIVTDYICAKAKQAFEEFPEGVCHGDDGGPLVYNKDTIVGILIIPRDDCNEKLYPALYAKVSKNELFINKAKIDSVGSDVRVAVHTQKTTTIGGVFTTSEELTEIPK